MKVTVKGYVTYVKYPWQEVGVYALFANPVSDADPSCVNVGTTVEAEVEIPDDFNPNLVKIATLEKQKEEAIKRLELINKQLQEVAA